MNHEPTELAPGDPELDFARKMLSECSAWKSRLSSSRAALDLTDTSAISELVHRWREVCNQWDTAFATFTEMMERSYDLVSPPDRRTIGGEHADWVLAEAAQWISLLAQARERLPDKDRKGMKHLLNALTVTQELERRGTELYGIANAAIDPHMMRCLDRHFEQMQHDSTTQSA